MKYFEILEDDWIPDLELEDLIEHIRLTGRLDSCPAQGSTHVADPGSYGTWEAMEHHCRNADRSHSVFFTDELIEERHRHREQIKKAAEVERKRRSRLLKAARRRIERERAEWDAQLKERYAAQEAAQPQLSNVASLVLTVLAAPGMKWTVDSIATLLHIDPFLIHIAIHELVRAGKLRRVPHP